METFEPRIVLAVDALVISEFMASNQNTLADGDGNYSDWIEIHNPTTELIDAAGWSLTDDANNLSKWTFPSLSQTQLAPDDFLVVFASGQSVDDYIDPAGNLHTDFKLQAGGEYLALVEPDGQTISHEYAPAYPSQLTDISYGLTDGDQAFDTLVDVGANLTYHVPTAVDAGADWDSLNFDDGNWTNTAVVDVADIVVTEISTGAVKSVEIQNATIQAVDTTGWTVLVNESTGGISAANSVAWSLPNSVDAIDTLYRTDQVGDNYWGSPLDWTLDGSGWVMIIDDAGEAVDFVAWGYTATQIANLSVDYGAFTGISVDQIWIGDGAESGAVGAGTGFIAYNDQASGAGTNAWTTTYGANGTSTGLLKDSGDGSDTNATLATSEVGAYFAGSGSNPSSGSDADLLFSGWVDFSTASGNSVELSGSDSYTHTFTGLDTGTSSTYNFAGTAIRGSANYTNRWTLITLQGADGATAAHSVGAGAIEINATQVAIWTGHNSTAGQGYVAAWENIDPGPDGQFSVISTQYTDSTPGVGSGTADGPKGYAVAGIRLEEIVASNPTEFLRRVGTADQDWADDFVRGTTGSLGATNPDLTIPLDSETIATTGIGFENDQPPYAALIRTDVETAMQDANASLWTRIEFEITDSPAYDRLTLKVQYDDGFVAFLNGVQVAAANDPATLAYNSTATAARSDLDAVQVTPFDISGHLDLLQVGTNVLAIQALNIAADDDDLLLLPQLVAESDTPPTQYMTTPTPGAANLPGSPGRVADTQFSVDRGFFSAPFQLDVSTATTGAEIRYTLDGSEPTETTGTIYTGPITVDQTTTLRAAAFRTGYLPTNVDTQTYLFLDDVLQQGNNPSGYPSVWAGYTADFEMDPQIVDAPQYSGVMLDTLTSIPTLSIVTEVDNLFDSSTGIYVNPYNTGSSWQRPTSVELINPDGSQGFQVDAGLRIQGGAGRNPRIPKHSFRLKFTSDIGPSKLNFPFFGGDATDVFETITLRAGYNNSWVHWSGTQRGQAQFIRDEFIRQSLREMGQVQSDGNFIQLYINGMYWGMYNAVERPDADFMASYFGGAPEDYDALNGGVAVNGDLAAWNELRNLINRDLTNPTNYAAISDRVNLESLADYALANIFGGNLDLKDNGNWYGGRERSPDGKWYFFAWDSERTLENVNENTISEDDGPMDFFQELRVNEEFRMLVADRVHLHFFNDGEWTSDKTIARYQGLADTIDAAIISESARWGDHRRDVNSITGGPYELYSHNDHWMPERDRILNNYLPFRSSNVLNQLRSATLYPGTVAPSFNQHGGHVATGFDLTISAPSGTIYYTLDGSDPREVGGGIGGTAVAYTGTPIDITSAVTVRARARVGGTWSAVNEAKFTVATAADASSLRITEINYNPHDANPVPGLGELDVDNDQFEFVELLNVGNEAIDLLGVQFVEVPDGIDNEGIVFTFDSQTLDAGERVLVVRDLAAFESRYGVGLNVAGEYDGKLANGGELITVLASDAQTIQQFEYNDSGDWPGRADGNGASLEVIETQGDYQSGSNWRSSNEYGGSPGNAGTGPMFDVVVNELLSHGGTPDQIELYNSTAAPIDVSRWYLGHTSSNLFQFQVSPDTTIDADQYLVLSESQLGFGFDGQFGDDIWLVEADNANGKPLRFADHHDFDATDMDVSLGRWPNGGPSGMLFPMTTPTFGSANSGPVFGDLLITEIHYSPDAVPPSEQGNITQDELEFVELYNASGSTVGIGNWSIQGIGFTFPEATTVAAGEAIVVVAFDPIAAPSKATAFRNVFSIDGSVRLFGAASGKLNNAGETIRLLRPEDPQTLLTGDVLVDAVRYDDAAPWPTTADGGGHSLTRTAPNDFAPMVTSWTAETPSPGSVAFAPTIPGDFNGDGAVNGDDFLAWQGGFGMSSGAELSDGDADGDGDVDGNDFLIWQENFGSGAIGGGMGQTVTAYHGSTKDDGKLNVRPFQPTWKYTQPSVASMPKSGHQRPGVASPADPVEHPKVARPNIGRQKRIAAIDSLHTRPDELAVGRDVLLFFSSPS